MKDNLIMFSSVTLAIRGRDLLKNNGINARMIRTPAHLRQKSCGYSLLISNEFDYALSLITGSGISIIGTTAVDFR